MGQCCANASTGDEIVDIPPEPIAHGLESEKRGKESMLKRLDGFDDHDEGMQAQLELIGVDFPKEELHEHSSLHRMKDLQKRIMASLHLDHHIHKPSFKHLKVQAHKLGASRRILVTSSSTGTGMKARARNMTNKIIKALGSTPKSARSNNSNGQQEERSGEIVEKTRAKPEGEEVVETAACDDAMLNLSSTDSAGSTVILEAENTQEFIEYEISNLIGIWKCIDTWGLEDFLKKCGIGFVQRKAAVSAPWPWWAFEHDDAATSIHFVNHGPLGEVEEHIDATGAEYFSFDAKKQKMTNKAYWDGDTLIIDRVGPQGKFSEKRHIDEAHRLQFSLQLMSGPHEGEKWGRIFERGDEQFHKS